MSEKEIENKMKKLLIIGIFLIILLGISAIPANAAVENV